MKEKVLNKKPNGLAAAIGWGALYIIAIALCCAGFAMFDQSQAAQYASVALMII